MLIETRLARAIFPGFDDEPAVEAVAVLGHLRRTVSFPLALAAFFSGCPLEFAMERCEPLKLSNKHVRHVEFLLAHRTELLDPAMPLAQLKRFLAEPYFWDLYELERAMQKAAASRQGLSRLGKLRRWIRDLGDVDVKPKPIHHDLRSGAAPGRFGAVAEKLYTPTREASGDVSRPSGGSDWLTRRFGSHSQCSRGGAGLSTARTH
jgi:hypothetical protein